MTPIGNGVLLVTRKEWGARAPKGSSKFTPSFGSTVHWEGPHMGTFDHTRCATKVRGIQAFHMDSRGWTDIAYSGVVCPHGYVFEGRGFYVRTAANGTNQGNSSAYAWCYLGGENDGYTREGDVAMKTILDYADRNGGAGPGRNCHRDWKPTKCPGDEICSRVKSVYQTPGTPGPNPVPPPTDSIPPAEVYAMPYPVIFCRERGPQYWVLTERGPVEMPGGAKAYDWYKQGVASKQLQLVQDLSQAKVPSKSTLEFDQRYSLCRDLATAAPGE